MSSDDNSIKETTINVESLQLQGLNDNNEWVSCKPLQGISLSVEFPIEFNFSPIPSEIVVGSIGVIVFPDNTSLQIIVSSIRGASVEAIPLDRDKWIENPVFKLDNLEGT